MPLAADKALQKRIRRHVRGRVHRFFAVTGPGLEPLCEAELAALSLDRAEGGSESGGVAFSGRPADCWRANLHLRTASRVLMRLERFKAENFSRFKQKIAALPWELFLYSDPPPRIRVTVRSSRLYHSQALAQRVAEGMAQRFQGHPFLAAPADIPAQTVFVRGLKDRFTVSLDSSGELLYKRGIKAHGGTAPLRETLAAAALKLAGYTGKKPLVDPMCGSGTFALEAAMMAAGIPAGWFREFAFMGWPCFEQKRWAYLRKSAGQAIGLPRAPILASDQDPAVCQALSDQLAKTGLSAYVRVTARDFFDFSPGERGMEPGLVALNPPYGLRLGRPEQTKAFFAAVISHLKTAYRNWNLALIAPDRSVLPPLRLQAVRIHTFFHGGLTPILLTARL